MLKKIVFIFALMLSTTPHFCNANEPQPEQQTPQSETTLDDVNDGIEPNLLDQILTEDPNINFPTDNPIDIPKQEVGVWKKLQMFWALPREQKAALLKQHIANHKFAYATSGSVLALLITLLVCKKICKS